MEGKVIKAVQIVDNYVIKAFGQSGVLEDVSERLVTELGRVLISDITDGNSYAVTMGAEFSIKHPEDNTTKFTRKIYFSEIVRCGNCIYTPEVDKELFIDGTVTHLYCNRMGEKVHPAGYCCWARKRGECINWPQIYKDIKETDI